MRLLRKIKALLGTGRALGLGLLLVSLSIPATALANSKYAGIVIDAKTGKTLYSSSADAYRYPASLTKIMTLYVVFEELEAGRLSLNSALTVSKYASGRPPTKLGLKPGQTIKVKDAILGLVTKSANDASTVIAENISGSEARFAERMTRTARSLGMSKTTFRNPHGLPDSRQRTTARDMATLGRAIQEHFPQYYGYFKTRAYKYKGRTYANHNKLLGRVKGVDGIKTGYTRASGFNLVSSVKRNGRHIVAVVMGGRTGSSRDAQMVKLIKGYLPKASRGARTAPAIAKRGAQPSFQAAKLDTVPLPTAKPQTGKSTGAPMVLALTAPAPVSVVPAPPPVPGFGDAVPVPPKMVKQRFDAAFAVATSLPPIPPQSPGASFTTNSISRAELLQAAKKEVSGTGKGQPASVQPARTVKVETIRIDPVPVTVVKADNVAGATKVASTAPVSVSAEQAATEIEDKDDTVTVATSDTQEADPGWQVQIAATETENQAIEMLKNAKARAGSALRGRKPYTEPVESGGQTLYRARFVGFDTKSAAWKACSSLKKAKYACFAIYQ
ncbi:D-alanyl-D-alanine carboxypeptidase [Labrenzia aggregata]|uniref:D-alanyl-D-alanine carboxypeptidase n=1 Tax=Roseibium aggregatum TaxID=187304 RepID=A0A939EE53_9HYPH|nr:D-alanyl-D-alanine carboxypeptidase [Roseibium aggregatum]MBN9670882.1 D-alanyl-D-alanine carboxypeptidase [Roseibium aggregatum]